MTCPIPSREGVEVARTATLRHGRDPLTCPESPGERVGTAVRSAALRQGLCRHDRGHRHRWGEHEGGCGHRDDDHQPKAGAALNRLARFTHESGLGWAARQQRRQQ